MAIPIKPNELLRFDSNGGLVELDLDLPKKLLYDSMVTEFKRHVPNQPDFFIAKKKWQLLAEGACLTPSGIKKNWVNKQHEGYEVFAFVFCVAFGKLESHGGCPAHLESSTPNPAMAYFRIRTILQKKGTQPTS